MTLYQKQYSALYCGMIVYGCLKDTVIELLLCSFYCFYLIDFDRFICFYLLYLC